MSTPTEKELSLAFMHYLEGALVVLEERREPMTTRESSEIYYEAYKESVKELCRRKEEAI